MSCVVPPSNSASLDAQGKRKLIGDDSTPNSDKLLQLVYISTTPHFYLLRAVKEFFYNMTVPFSIPFGYLMNGVSLGNLDVHGFGMIHIKQTYWYFFAALPQSLFYFIIGYSCQVLDKSDVDQLQERNPLFSDENEGQSYFVRMDYVPIFPIALFSLHRAFIACKYGSLTNMEYNRLMKTNNHDQATMYQNQLQVVAAWRKPSKIVLDFELYAAARHNGAKLDSLLLNMTPGQEAFWVLWMEKYGMDVEQNFIKTDDKIQVTLRTMCALILKTVSSNDYKSFSFNFTCGLIALFVAIYPIFMMELDQGSGKGPRWLPPPDQGGLLYFFYFAYIYTALLFFFIIFQFMDIVLVDSLRRKDISRILKRMLKVVTSGEFDANHSTEILSKTLLEEYGGSSSASTETENQNKSWFSFGSKSPPPKGKDLKLVQVKDRSPATSEGKSKSTLGEVKRTSCIDDDLSSFQKTLHHEMKDQSTNILEESMDANYLQETNATIMKDFNVAIPRLSMDTSTNVYAWLYARSIMQIFGSRYKARIDLYTGLILVMLLLCIVTNFLLILEKGSDAFAAPLFAPLLLLGSFGLLHFMYSISIMADCNFEYSKHKKNVSLQLMVIQSQLHDAIEFKLSGLVKDPEKKISLQEKIDTLDEATNSCIRALDTINAQDEQNCLRVLGIKAEYTLVVSIATAIGTVISAVVSQMNEVDSATSST